MENRALRLPRAEPLLHVPVSAIVEFVSNRSEAEVLLRIGDLGHEFDHLTRTLVQWLEHEQHLTADSCVQEEQQPVEDIDSLVFSLVPLARACGQQARSQGAAAEDNRVPAAAAEIHGRRPSVRQPKCLFLARAAPLWSGGSRRAASPIGGDRVSTGTSACKVPRWLRQLLRRRAAVLGEAVRRRRRRRRRSGHGDSSRAGGGGGGGREIQASGAGSSPPRRDSGILSSISTT
ncbi:unnamed protein product, partial [Ectocarpus fasciculatus]